MVRIMEALYSVTELTVVQRNTGLGGADFGAIAAIRTLIRIYDIYRIGRGDSLLRAFRDTGVTHDTVVINLVGQKRLPLRQSIRARFFA